MKGTFKAELTPNHFNTGQGWTIQQFVQRPESETPGDVGICLSGGGSRAMSAGMGQLRALAHLQRNGKSLLSQTKAVSTVSGGSWLGVPFTYLTPGTTDAGYLNEFVADPGRLVLKPTSGHSPAEVLNRLPSGNIGNAVTSDFSLSQLALQALSLWLGGTPSDFLWQALMGIHILEPYDLYEPGDESQPTSLFSFDSEVLKRDITDPNPDLANVPAQLVASGRSRQDRPFLICNTAMFLRQAGVRFQQLAPVQATPFVSGILGHPTPGVDANGKIPGGGGVTSFAFSSNPTAVDGSQVSAEQARQFALTDIVGASSAAFAERLQNIFEAWRAEPQSFIGDLKQHSESINAFNSRWSNDPGASATLLEMQMRSDEELIPEMERALLSITDVIPQYRYWPVKNAEPARTTKPTRFADAGSLENSGINGMLAYSDIRNLASFVNTATSLSDDADRGIIDADGNEVPNTRIIVADMIPPLFGYQPYTAGKGYRLYEGVSSPTFPQGKNSRVFPPEKLADVLQGLWAAKQGGDGVFFAQNGLDVSDNAWFGIQGNRQVNVLWVYLSTASTWQSLLSEPVQRVLGTSDFQDFPHFSTFSTELTATQINLLASLTAWTVGDDRNKNPFLDLYRDGFRSPVDTGPSTAESIS